MRRNSDRDNTFLLKSNKVLKKEIGEFNALAIYQEIAYKEFEKSLTDKSITTNYSIKTFAEESHKLPLTHRPFGGDGNLIHKAYLIYPQACFDHFLDSFEREIRLFMELDEGLIRTIEKEWDYVKSQKTKLNRLLEVLKRHGCIIDIPNEYYYSYEYYRLARNEFAHDGASINLKTAFSSINRSKILTILPEWRHALEEYNKFVLDDLVAYSVVVKRIADCIAVSFYKSIKWEGFPYKDDADIKTLVSTTKSRNETLPKFKSKLQNFMVSTYGVKIPEEYVDTIVYKLFD